jgi:heme oxygenase
MERALAKHSDHPLLASIYNPSILARTQGISEDISYLLDLPAGQDWQSHPKAKQYQDRPPTALSTYVNRIKACDEESRSIPIASGSYVYPPPPSEAYLLLAHAYVRYMGDLNGGQQIKERVAKAYQLEPGSDVGLRFYRFEGPDGGEASPAELGKITASLRKGMDSIGDQLSPEQRTALLQEANHAFELNILLFSSFSENEEKKSNLLVPQADTAAHIPSPSLEGYAKAANYMPREKAKELRAERKAALKQSSSVASNSLSMRNMILLALMLPAFLAARTILQKILS